MLNNVMGLKSGTKDLVYANLHCCCFPVPSCHSKVGPAADKTSVPIKAVKVEEPIQLIYLSKGENAKPLKSPSSA